MLAIDDKCESILINNTGELPFIGEPLILVTASSILDVGRGPGFVPDIFCIDY